MIHYLVTKLGAFKGMVLITGLVSFLSVSLYSLLSIFFLGPFEPHGLAIAAIIPLIIAPPILYLILKISTQMASAQKALHESEGRYRNILETIEEGYFEVDLSGNLTFVNEAVCRFSGYSREQLLGMNNREYVTRETARRMYRVFSEIYRTGKPSRMTHYEVITKSGEHKVIELSTSLMRDVAENPIGFKGMTRDITERRHGEQALRESEEKYRQLVDHAPTGIYEIDFTTGQFISVNDVMCEYTGYTKEEFKTLSPFEMLSEESAEAFMKRLEKMLAGETQPENVEYKIRGKSGREFWVLLNSSFTYEDGKPIRATAVVHDISERKLAEEALQQSEERYRTLVENTLDGYFICRIPSGRFLFLNQRICQLFGYTMTEGLNLALWDVIDPDDHDKIRGRLDAKTEDKEISADRKTFTAVNKKGDNFRIEMSTSVVTFRGEQALQGVLRDITEHEALQKQLQQAQRMEAIGTLAGGFAHDFNNLLMGIWGNISLMHVNMNKKHPQYGRLKNIESFIKSGADLTRQLLGFARGGKYQVEPTDPNVIMDKTAAMFGRTKKEIRIHTTYLEDIWTVEIDRSQIEQVFLNLYVNAWQAMPEGGDLHLSTENVIMNESYADQLGLTPGRYAKMSVADTGIGMDEETQGKIFDPFFTTKEMERGTGLGLASAYGIVKNHNGLITVQSEKGLGTTLDVYLPASEKTAEKEKTVLGNFQRGSEGILLVDDEEAILEVGKEMMEYLGYHVLTADSGREALETYGKNRGRIDMVVLDMIMPDMSGGAAFERLKEMDPAVKVLLCSGYSEDGQAKEIMSHGCNGFIQKPFNLMDLSQKVRDILEEQRTGGL
ncbi:MAG: PAS domain S-box protein [Deltaproteobacteria bacterium]|nr:PAS domain S-box protein [Deltaproteobacteria bacterium]